MKCSHMGPICLSFSVGVKTSCPLTYNLIFPKPNRILTSCRTWKQQENAINQICARPVISFSGSSFHLPHIFQYCSQPLFSVIIDFMVCIYRLMKRSDKRPLSWLHTMQRLKVFLNDYIDWLYDPFVLPKPHKKAHNVKWNTSLHRCKWLHKMQGKQNQASCT